MKKTNIGDLPLEDLKLIRSFIETYNDINTMKSEVDRMIEKKEDNRDLNHRLTIELMKQLHFFDKEMFDILNNHNIKNIQDLIDSNLDEWNLTHQRRLELEEAKVWYDFSNLDDNIGKIKKKSK